jgi:hypothetical protein
MAIRIFKSDPNGPALPGWPDMRGTFDVSFTGAVLSTGERNGYSDSDFFATVWDDASGTVKTIDYATTRGWTYANSASVDATPEVREKAAKFFAARNLEARLAKAAEAAATPAKGKTVTVVKGRKVPKGTTGIVIWVGGGKYFGPTPRYKSSTWSTKGALRVGLKDADGTVHWTAASNVVVVNPAAPDVEALTKLADATGREYAGLNRMVA